ncbi:MAG: HlyD family efflux transporter periplasmic adaptor subunit, partial [Pseudomonadota bacterium]
MRFLIRALSGVFLLALTVGFLVLGVGVLVNANKQGDERSRGGRPAQERLYTVSVQPVERATVTPVSRAFGRLQSWQTADVRSASVGSITKIGPDVRDGGRVAKGDLLFEIDPLTAENTLASRETDLNEARTELSEALRSQELSREELVTAEAQHRLRERALSRARDLKQRGFDTDAGVETAELNLASSAQSLVTRRQAIAQAEARVARAEIGIERRTLARDAAVRDLEDTRIYAPFEGVLSNVDAVVGRRVSANEQLAVLIDPSALEVAFRVSVEAFAHLVDERGNVLEQPLTVEFEMGARDIQLQARISRISAEVGDGQSGRLVYAELQPPLPGALTVGDFVTVAIEEPALDNVSLIPRAAATDDGAVLLVGEDNRLIEERSVVERRQGDSLIVSGLPEGAPLVLARTAQLGPGVRVKAVGPDPQIAQRETVKLTADQQAQLRSVIESNTRMPADVR